MPPMPRILCLAFQAAALLLIAGPGSTPLLALASPLPMPLAMLTAKSTAMASSAHHANGTVGVLRNVRFAGRKVELPSKRTVSPASMSAKKALKATRRVSRIKRSHKPSKSQQELYNEYYAQIKEYHDKLAKNADDLRGLASRSSTIEDGNAHFTTSSASVLTDYHSNILGLDGILGNLGARKGLLNYDRSNTLETILKDIVNLNKDVLSSITVLVYNLPIVGKTLGPIVYQIKCVLDTVLNTVENLTDGLLNVLKPLLGPVIGGLFTAACHSGSGLNLSGCPL